MNIEKLKAYLPNIFSELRKKNHWSLNQTKLFMFALSHLYKHKVKIDNKNYTNKDVELINIRDVPRVFEISRNDIIEITKIPISQFSREIKKITYGIM